MTPERIIPSQVEGFVVLQFPKLVLNVPETFLRDHQLALDTKEDSELKELAIEIEIEILKEDPVLISHLVQAFLFIHKRTNPPPEQLDLFPLERGHNKDIDNFIDLKEEAEKLNELLEGYVLDAPKIYKESKKKGDLYDRINLGRGFIWLVSIIGITGYALYNLGEIHWAWYAGLAFLLIFNRKIILDDKPNQENTNENKLI